MQSVLGSFPSFHFALVALLGAQVALAFPAKEATAAKAPSSTTVAHPASVANQPASTPKPAPTQSQAPSPASQALVLYRPPPSAPSLHFTPGGQKAFDAAVSASKASNALPLGQGRQQANTPQAQASAQTQSSPSAQSPPDAPFSPRTPPSPHQIQSSPQTVSRSRASPSAQTAASPVESAGNASSQQKSGAAGAANDGRGSSLRESQIAAAAHNTGCAVGLCAGSLAGVYLRSVRPQSELPEHAAIGTAAGAIAGAATTPIAAKLYPLNSSRERGIWGANASIGGGAAGFLGGAGGGKLADYLDPSGKTIPRAVAAGPITTGEPSLQSLGPTTGGARSGAEVAPSTTTSSSQSPSNLWNRISDSFKSPRTPIITAGPDGRPTATDPMTRTPGFNEGPLRVTEKVGAMRISPLTVGNGVSLPASVIGEY